MKVSCSLESSTIPIKLHVTWLCRTRMRLLHVFSTLPATLDQSGHHSALCMATTSWFVYVAATTLGSNFGKRALYFVKKYHFKQTHWYSHSHLRLFHSKTQQQLEASKRQNSTTHCILGIAWSKDAWEIPMTDVRFLSVVTGWTLLMVIICG